MDAAAHGGHVTCDVRLAARVLRAFQAHCPAAQRPTAEASKGNLQSAAHVALEVCDADSSAGGSDIAGSPSRVRARSRCLHLPSLRAPESASPGAASPLRQLQVLGNDSAYHAAGTGLAEGIQPATASGGAAQVAQPLDRDVAEGMESGCMGADMEQPAWPPDLQWRGVAEGTESGSAGARVAQTSAGLDRPRASARSSPLQESCGPASASPRSLHTKPPGTSTQQARDSAGPGSISPELPDVLTADVLTSDRVALPAQDAGSAPGDVPSSTHAGTGKHSSWRVPACISRTCFISLGYIASARNSA